VTAPIDKARGQVYLARDLAGAGKADEALEILETAKGIARDSNNQKLLADIVRVSGDAWLQVGEFEQSWTAFQQAEKTYQTLGLGAEQSQAIFGMAKATRELGQMD